MRSSPLIFSVDDHGRPTAHLVPIGYWREDEHPDLPDPTSEGYVGPGEPVGFFPLYHCVSYLERGDAIIHYRGYSNCRICGMRLGICDLSDDTYVWPEGYEHYLISHGILPPSDFVRHVLLQRDASKCPAPRLDIYQTMRSSRRIRLCPLSTRLGGAAYVAYVNDMNLRCKDPWPCRVSI